MGKSDTKQRSLSKIWRTCSHQQQSPILASPRTIFDEVNYMQISSFGSNLSDVHSWASIYAYNTPSSQRTWDFPHSHKVLLHFITPHPQNGRNYDSDRTVRRTLLLMSNAPAEPQEPTWVPIWPCKSVFRWLRSPAWDLDPPGRRLRNYNCFQRMFLCSFLPLGSTSVSLEGKGQDSNVISSTSLAQK